ncbi:MAG TPA: hypothetical protein VNA17_07045, partial [Pyrinomonadaceae bacterium]|nr:hypothetical protein [Pyrinomonadaceae bacterium]
KYRRAVLYAAYRYIAGSGLNALEQKELVELWKADIENKDFNDNSIEEAVRSWIERRKDVAGQEEKLPDIYTERAYGGYDFFPNCTKNAFETASETLADRAGKYGPTDPNIGNWLTAQDQVFANCSSGKQTPAPAPPGAPEWLQKDRAYQLAAASFYSLDYADAKRRFAEIAQDNVSPWQETADYLVARTLIRQASLTKDAAKSAGYYDAAEDHLRKFTSRTGKFTASAERLTGLVKYRRHPKERVSELARQLTFHGGGENFRQDVIDYNWLLDKFESEALNAEQKRRESQIAPDPTKAFTDLQNTQANAAPLPENRPFDAASNTNGMSYGVKKQDDDITIYLSSDDAKNHYTIYVGRTATDEEAIEVAEKVVGYPLTAEMAKRVRESRRSGYVEQFSSGQQSGYEGSYYGDEKLTPSLMPDFLRDPLSDWLFTYQAPGAEAYLYSLKQFREGGSELWLMTALSKADKSSTQLAQLLEAATNTSRTSFAYPTIAYHTARIWLEQGKNAEARKLLDEMINSGDALPISARNSFIELRLKLAETLEDFLKYSLKKPFAFDFDGHVGSVEEIIAEQKTYYNTEWDKQGREAYDAEVETRYTQERLWQGRLMFDSPTVELFNLHFPTVSLLEVMRSKALPDYMRERFAVAIWTRAFLMNDIDTMLKIAPELGKYRPEFEALLSKIKEAKTPVARENATLFFVLKNPLLSPYLEDGMGKTDNESGDFDSNDWWCEPYDMEYSDETHSEVPRRLPPRPAFLSATQSQTAQTERKRLKQAGDAPEFLAEKVLAWAKRSPNDRRVPEALYIMIGSNGWTKYGCGNNEKLQKQMTTVLKRQYPNSEWTAKLIAEERES